MPQTNEDNSKLHSNNMFTIIGVIKSREMLVIMRKLAFFSLICLLATRLSIDKAMDMKTLIPNNRRNVGR